MTAVLSRLLLEDRVGLMDSPKPPRPVFTPEEILHLSQFFTSALADASPTEWVSFLINEPIGTDLLMTSGGLFQTRERLHIVLANHRTRVQTGSEEAAKIEAHPFYTLRGPGGTLTFESSRFVMGREANWSGGHRASASELILDHRAFLTFRRQPGIVGTNPGTTEAMGGAREGQTFDRKTPVSETADTREQGIIELRQEVQRLKQRVAEQELEIQRLKERGLTTPSPKPAP